MGSYSVLVRLAIGISLLCVADSFPSHRRQWFYPIFDDIHQGECVHIQHTCNRVFNRTDSESYAKFPNTRGLTLNASISEFNDFFLALSSNISGCSLALWSLLCYHYFPQCNPTLPLMYTVTPCREICEQARNGCEDYIGTGNFSWPEHLNCAKFNSSHDDDLCINRTADPGLANKAIILSDPTSHTTTDSTPSPPVKIEPDESNTTEPDESNTTETRPPPPTNSSLQCHSRRKCNFRTKATGGTFKNNDYTFAANVTILGVNSKRTHHTFLAEVTRSWILEDQNCSVYENHSMILIRTSYSHCEMCPGFNITEGSNVYLVAGYCSEVGWYLPPNDSLVSPWFSNPKYQTKLETWIRNGIEARAHND